MANQRAVTNILQGIAKAVQASNQHVLSVEWPPIPKSMRVGIPSPGDGVAFCPCRFKVPEQHVTGPPPGGTIVGIETCLFRQSKALARLLYLHGLGITVRLFKERGFD